MTGNHPSFASASIIGRIARAGHDGNIALAKAELSSDSATNRAFALGAMHRSGHLNCVTLCGFFTDPSPAVRRRAAEIAARTIKPGSLEQGLVKLLDDDSTVSEAAAFAIGEIGSEYGVELAPETVEALERQARQHQDALCRESAIAALGAVHKGLSTILFGCNDKATVRRRAVIALAPFDGPEVTAALEKALGDKDWQVRQAAEDLLADQAAN